MNETFYEYMFTKYNGSLPKTKLEFVEGLARIPVKALVNYLVGTATNLSDRDGWIVRFEIFDGLGSANHDTRVIKINPLVFYLDEVDMPELKDSEIYKRLHRITNGIDYNFLFDVFMWVMQHEAAHLFIFNKEVAKNILEPAITDNLMQYINNIVEDLYINDSLCHLPTYRFRSSNLIAIRSIYAGIPFSTEELLESPTSAMIPYLDSFKRNSIKNTIEDSKDVKVRKMGHIYTLLDYVLTSETDYFGRTTYKNSDFRQRLEITKRIYDFLVENNEDKEKGDSEDECENKESGNSDPNGEYPQTSYGGIEELLKGFSDEKMEEIGEELAQAGMEHGVGGSSEFEDHLNKNLREVEKDEKFDSVEGDMTVGFLPVPLHDEVYNGREYTYKALADSLQLTRMINRTRKPKESGVRLHRNIFKGSFYKNSNIFRGKKDLTKWEGEFIILVDISGSTRCHAKSFYGEPTSLDEKMVLSAYNMKQRVESMGYLCRLFVHTTYREPDVVIYEVNNENEARNVNGIYNYGNADGVAINAVGKLFSGKTKNEVLFCLSDGRPVEYPHGTGFRSALEHTKDAYQRLVKTGVKFISLSLTEDAVYYNDKIYGEDNYDVSSQDEKVLGNTFQKIIEKYMSI